jgi:ribosomal protein S27AE
MAGKRTLKRTKCPNCGKSTYIDDFWIIECKCGYSSKQRQLIS